MRQIVINPDDLEEGADARSLVDGLRDRVLAGEDFSALAKEFSHDVSASNGGDVGTMAEEQMAPSVARAVFEAEAGSVAEVVTTSEGLVLVQVDAVFPAETTEFDDVKKEIAETITAEKQVGEVAQAYAERVLASWTVDGTPSADLLLEQNVIALDTPTFPIASPGFPGLSDSPALMKSC